MHNTCQKLDDNKVGYPGSEARDLSLMPNLTAFVWCSFQKYQQLQAHFLGTRICGTNAPQSLPKVKARRANVEA